MLYRRVIFHPTCDQQLLRFSITFIHLPEHFMYYGKSVTKVKRALHSSTERLFETFFTFDKYLATYNNYGDRR